MKEEGTEQKPVYFDRVFDLDGYESNNFPAVAINRKNVRHARANKLFVLVQVEFMSEVRRSIRYWIHQAVGKV